MPSLEELYPIAKRLAKGFYVPGMDKNDLAQEAIIHAWKHPTETKASARTVMYYRLVQILRSAKKPHMTNYNVDSPLMDDEVPFVKGCDLEKLQISPPQETLLIPKTKEGEKVLVALRKNGGYIVDAAQELGITPRIFKRKLLNLRKELE